MTSSPGPMPAASSARCSALVPVFTAMPWLRLRVGRELLLETGDLAAQRELAAVQHALDGRVDFALDRRVLRLQIDEGNHAAFLLSSILTVSPLRRTLRRIDRLHRFDHLDDAQAELPVGHRRLAVHDAIDEVRAFDGQRLGARQLRRPHVAGAVADAHLLDLCRIVGEADALVVDLDLLAGLEVVIGDHLACAAQVDLPHLDRGQPADAGVRDRARVVEQRDVGQVLGCAEEVVGAVGRNRHRVFAQQVIEDREVVHRQIGDHADVALEQAQVHAHRVVVETRPSSPLWTVRFIFITAPV